MVVAEVGTIAIVVELLINIERGLRDRDRVQNGAPDALISSAGP